MDAFDATTIHQITPGTIIVSPNYPYPYSPGRTFGTAVQLRSEEKITLYFLSFVVDSFDVSRTNDCLDYLEATSINDPSLQIVDPLCGQSRPRPVATNANQALLKFISDNDKSYHGFKIKIDRGK